jgi:hypothetical protein
LPTVIDFIHAHGHTHTHTRRHTHTHTHTHTHRSHECKEEGYEVEHNGKCITIFSAPNYCDQMGNKGAFIHLDKTLKVLTLPRLILF